jgi:hypothetical protein
LFDHVVLLAASLRQEIQTTELWSEIQSVVLEIRVIPRLSSTTHPVM